MKRLLGYLKQYQKESIIAPLFKMLEASFELLVPLVVASMIDMGIRSQDSAHILKMGGLLVLLAVIGIACSLTAQYFAAKAAIGAGTALRNDLFAHIHKLSYAEIDTIGTATLITRMTGDINTVQNGVNMVLLCSVWRYGYGIYSRYQRSHGICLRHSPSFNRGIRHSADQYAAV